MCTGAEAALLVATTASTMATMDAAEQGKKRAQQALDQSKKAETERKAAEDKAVQDSYSQNVMARRAIRSNSLFTGGGQQTLGV